MYLAETLLCDFPHPGDSPALVLGDVIVDGPYTSTALAERALDLRIEGPKANGMVRLLTPLEIKGVGVHDSNGGASSWVREIEWVDPRQRFESREAWQQIRKVFVDSLPA
jgi:hypothetical protein